ncbi:MAG: glutamate-1-semialdehyde 2,1-aminomutase [Phycisphaerales bacterium]|nr:glutamate-1-semialdehyde 2,1-aminomutase [Phycisphaerales bacterium]
MDGASTIRRPNSASLFDRAANVLVGGVSSPVRAFKAVGGRPVFVERMNGPHVYDVDGRRYVDLVGSWGTAIVGHAHPDVVATVQRAAAAGLSFGACCAAEAQLGERILSAIPGADRIRFVNSGTEAAMSALRLARAATGRSRVLKFAGCYHGHVDALLVAAGSGAAAFGIPDSAGVPPDVAASTLIARYNDLPDVRRIMDTHGPNIAAIIVEPLAGNMGMIRPVDGFLSGLRSLCDRHGSLLILDEIITAFRVTWGGYQNICGVTPDITCLGKTIGGGLPVAAYAGSRALMEQISPTGPVYQAGTLSGNPVAMATGIATLDLCRRDGFYESLHARSTALASALADAASAHSIPLVTDALGGMMGFAFGRPPLRDFDDVRGCDHQRFARFFHAMLDRGVWLPPSGYETWFLSAAHDDDSVAHVVDAASESFRLLNT